MNSIADDQFVSNNSYSTWSDMDWFSGLASHNDIAHITLPTKPVIKGNVQIIRNTEGNC